MTDHRNRETFTNILIAETIGTFKLAAPFCRCTRDAGCCTVPLVDPALNNSRQVARYSAPLKKVLT